MSTASQMTLQFLSSAKTLSCSTTSAQWLSLTTKLSHLSLSCSWSIPLTTTPIFMGCPRISPGGVTKRKWRTMRAKKAKQLHEAGLARERQLYKMRKRAERRAAVIELERPWETVEKPPNLLSVSDEEQLEDWFQKPGDLDLLSDTDGPELLSLDSGLPLSCTFPEGVGHSVYGKTGKMVTTSEEYQSSCLEDSRPGPINRSVGRSGLQRLGRCKNSRSCGSGLDKGGSVPGFHSRGLNGGAEKR